MYRSSIGWLYVDPSDPDGASSGLSFPSLVSCNNLFTIEQGNIRHVTGHLSDVLNQIVRNEGEMAEINKLLRLGGKNITDIG